MVPFELHTVGIVHKTSHCNAHHDVLQFGILLFEIVNVVGYNKLDVQFTCDLHKLWHNGIFVSNAVTLNFDVVVVAKQIFVLLCKLQSFLVAVGKQKTWQLACNTCGKAHQAFGILFESFEVDTWLGVEALDKCDGVKSAKVVVAHVVFGKKHQVEVLAVGNAFGVQVFAHVYFATNDGFDTLVFGSF